MLGTFRVRGADIIGKDVYLTFCLWCIETILYCKLMKYEGITMKGDEHNVRFSLEKPGGTATDSYWR